jgi:hypothetical protein
LHNLSFMNAKMKELCLSSIDLSIETTISTSSYSHRINKPFLLNVFHNFVTRLLSKGLAIALSVCVFILNLNMNCYKFKRLTLKGSTTWSNDGLPFSIHSKCILITLICKWEREINIKSNRNLWIYNVEGIHQLRINETFI